MNFWDILTGNKIKTFKAQGHFEGFNRIRFSPHERLKRFNNRSFFYKVLMPRLSPNGKTIASASGGKTIKLWDITTGKKIKTFEGHSQGVNRVSFSPDGKTIASASGSGKIRLASTNNIVKLWDINTGREITTLQGHSRLVNSISFSPDGKAIASASHDGTVILWNFDLESLLSEGCNLIGYYLQHNPDVSESDKRICNDN